MKRSSLLVLGIILVLSSCANPSPMPTQTAAPPTPLIPSATPRNLMLPTWTPSPTPPRKPTATPRDTPTPLPTSNVIIPGVPANLSKASIIDRPTYAQLTKPANLVTMEYDPSIWMLNSYYPTTFMGYSLSNRSNYDCKLEPSVGKGAEGYEVEHYSRSLGKTRFEIARVSQAGVLAYANYCTGEGQDYTCYQMTPGADHTACTEAAETVLATFKLIPNPFFGNTIASSNRWICQDASGTVGLCLISYSIPLNTLTIGPDGQLWAAGDDGILFRRQGQIWDEVSSPATHALYDLSFSSMTSGWAVGNGAEVLHWDGNTWSEVLPYHGPGEGPGGSTQVLFAVDAYANNDVWMVGYMKGLDGKNSPYALHWNGKDLVEEEAFPECNCGLNTVLVIDHDNVFAAGGSDMGAIIFHWDGDAWSSTSLAGADHLYTLVQAIDGRIWAGGIEVARDQSDTRGVLFYWDGTQWQRIATPPLTGGIYALGSLATGQIVLGGEFSALWNGSEWQPILTDIAGFGWIVDIETDPQGNMWALTRYGDIFKFGIERQR